MPTPQPLVNSMTIDFGRVEKYVKERGFGFVSHTFSEVPPTQAFFHIKVLKRDHAELAQALSSTTTIGQAYFWYEYQASPKGREVVAILKSPQEHQHHRDKLDAVMAVIKAQWLKLDSHLSEALRRAAVDLLPADEISALAERKESLEAERKRRQEEFFSLESARLQEIAQARVAQQRAEAAKLKASSDERAHQQRTEEEEFLQLVAELSALGFTHSNQVSRHIVANKLGHKYRHISGILQMESQGNVWDFNGGFPPKIYARLCEELGLGNQGSRAVPRKFTPYKDIFDY